MQLVISVTRLGVFSIFGNKVAQMFGDFLGSCENECFLSQTGQTTIRSTFGKTWASFISTFGHTVSDAKFEDMGIRKRK